VKAIVHRDYVGAESRQVGERDHTALVVSVKVRPKSKYFGQPPQ